jgi:archaetidylinositol phosphate synthase
MSRSPVPMPRSHQRDHRSVLMALEKRALIWIAVRLPAWINSDHLSALGLFSMLGAGASFAAFRLTPLAAPAVVVCLVANWLGDSLDGTLARVRGHERPRYGFYVDHVIDCAGTMFLLGGLACSGVMSPLLAMIVLAAYLLVCAETYLATHAVGVFRISFLGLGPTELRILLAAGAVKVMYSPHVTLPVFAEVRLFDVGGAIAAIALVTVFLVSTIRNGRVLYAAEPIASRLEKSRAA